jgi:adenosylcobinamide-phosphate guanylyltransferase
MRALIMAGGAGSRLDLGEKPIIPLCGRPMIEYIITAFRQAGCEPVVVASPRTPMTQNWCRANNITLCKTEGTGFIEDMIDAIQVLEEKGPAFITVSDIPGITSGIIRSILTTYKECNKEALSTWVPATMVRSSCRGMPYREPIDGIEACPVGINILRGDRISEIQDEYALLLHEPRLALNVNTGADLAFAETLLKSAEPE